MGATDTLLALCNEILAVFSIESGKVTERLESFELVNYSSSTSNFYNPWHRIKNSASPTR